jgi:SAM-dependent methyltransferase
MNPESYRSYSHEVTSWLHAGRKQLIYQVLEWNLSLEKRNGYDILEVGAGVGQNIEVLQRFGRVDALELDQQGLDRLRKIDGIRTIFELGIPSDLVGTWDVICACDVIEHIEDDVAAVQWIFEHLRPGGIFFATVPAFQWIYSDHDRALGHFRRYEADAFDKLLPKYAIRLSGSYFNTYLMPIAVISRALYQIGRWFRRDGKMEKQKILTEGVAEKCLRRVFKCDIQAITPSTRRVAGLSYYVCARKPER